VTAVTVARLLRQAGYRLQGNAKTVEGKQHPDRDAQFRYINAQVPVFQAAGHPVISVDPKKGAGRQLRQRRGGVGACG